MQQIIGELLWLARTVRADIPYAVTQLASRVLNWSGVCDKQLRHLVGYLLQSWDAELNISAAPGDTWQDLKLYVYSDASLSVPRSHSGTYIVAITSNGSKLPMDWISRSQKLASTSSAASETIAAHEAVMAALAQSVCYFDKKIYHPTDNKALLHNIRRGCSEKLSYLQRALKLRSYFLHDVNQRGLVKSDYTNTKTQLADCFTKPLTFPACREAAEEVGLVFGPGCGQLTQDDLEHIILED